MVVAKEFAARIAEAHSYFLWMHKRKSCSQEELAAMVSEVLGDRVGQTTVGGWFRGTVPPVKTIEAIAAVYRVDPGWLAFGDATVAPAPGIHSFPAQTNSISNAVEAEDTVIENTERPNRKDSVSKKRA